MAGTIALSILVPMLIAQRPGARGVRFAPSPTGTFHLGNLRTAWISHRLARDLQTHWIVRFEDIDGPRVIAGAREGQLRDMAALGLTPDQTLLQSEALPRHRDLFERAVATGAVYPCFCSRKEVREALEASASAPHGREPVYSGRCRQDFTRAMREDLPSIGWRFRSPRYPSGAQDWIIGRTDTAEALASFQPAYHWACAIDDWDGNHQLLVRAWDLEQALRPQQEIQRWLAGLEGVPFQPAPVFHTSLLTQDDGHRVEKRTRGVTLRELVACGWSAPLLLEAMKRSWRAPDLRSDWRSDQGSAWGGEQLKSIRLADLGIRMPSAQEKS